MRTTAHTGGMFLAGVLILAAYGHAQSAPAGKELFDRRCGGCHSLDRDLEGPRLRGVYGRPAGSIASFEYSQALKNSNIKWSAETLDQWLTDPEQRVPGSDMNFRVPKAE